MDTKVVGRDSELATIDEFLSAEGLGFGCLVLEGDAGIGKSTIWRVAVRSLQQRGGLTLSCCPSQSETRLSFAALGDLFSCVADDLLESLPAPQRRALDVALLRVAGDATPPDQRAVAVAVLSALRELGTGGPVCVAVDDAQWLDASTSSVLEFAARRLDAEPVRFLCAVRSSSPPVRTFDLAVREDRRTVMRIGPLSVGALHEMTKDRLGHVFLRPTLVKIQQASGGNPFFALEIARELLASGEPAAGAPLPVPDDVRDLVWARVRRLPDETRDALLAAAALSHPTTSGVSEEALRIAEQADIVNVDDSGRVLFTHPLFASAVYESASPARRVALHRRLAGAVDDVEERARHLALATTEPDEEIAQALEAGAASARARGAWQSAAELLARARELTPSRSPDAASRRGIAAAMHHLREGDRRHTKALLEEIASETPDGPLRGDALRLLAEIAYSDGSLADAGRLFAEALAFTEDARLASLIELGAAYVDAMSFDVPAAAAHAGRALEWANRAGVDAVVAEALAAGAMLDFLSGHDVDWGQVERSLELEDPSRFVPMMARPSSLAALLCLLVGRLSEARDRLLAVRSFASERGDERDLPFFLGSLVWVETWSGNFAAAADYAVEAAMAAALTGAGSTRVWALAQRGLLRAHQGEVSDARNDCADAVALAEETGWAISTPWIVYARCLLELSLGDAAAAWQTAEPFVGLIEASEITEPILVLFLPDALEALIAQGQLDRAEQLLVAFEQRADVLDRGWARGAGARVRGLLLAARGDLVSAESALARAVAEHARLEMPFERARALLALGQVQRRRKQRKTARETLGDALGIFEMVGAPLWADKARAEFARTHVREAPKDLSPTERNVAELAARGLTNKQIAERLFVSPKTVEANLARAYAKLGIRSRAQLGAAMPGGPPSTPTSNT